MFKRIALLAIVILGIGMVFYLANRLGSLVLWLMGFIGVGTLIRYGSIILIGGNSGRLRAYFKRHSDVRIKLIDERLNQKQIIPSDLSMEETAALLILSMVQKSLDIALSRTSELPAKVFSDEFFRYMAQVLRDTRTMGLSREFQLQLVGLGETLAKKYQVSEWVNEFQKQREMIFKRHAEGIPVIRAPR